MTQKHKKRAQEQETGFTVLGIDSSQPFCSMTVLRGGDSKAEMMLHSPLPYSSHLLPSVHHILASLDLTVQNVDLFAVANGPGSFTGIRIGLSSMMGLAAPDGKPVAGISSLRAIAWKSRHQGNLLIPLMQTARGLIYSGVYEHRDGNILPLRADRIDSVETLLSGLPEEDCVFCGTGVAGVEDVLKKKPGRPPTIHATDPYLGRAVARLGLVDYSAGCDLSLQQLKANYIRPSDAEYKFLEKGN